jgi:hypothetical protein
VRAVACWVSLPTRRICCYLRSRAFDVCSHGTVGTLSLPAQALFAESLCGQLLKAIGKSLPTPVVAVCIYRAATPYWRDSDAANASLISQEAFYESTPQRSELTVPG